MDKKKRRKIIVLSICILLVVALIVTIIVVGNRKSGATQFAVENSDLLSYNPFEENEERSDNSLLEYGKVLSKYQENNQDNKYTGEDIVYNASDFYGISFAVSNGETIYLYRGDTDEFETVTYRGRNYSYTDVMSCSGDAASFSDEAFVAEIQEVLDDIFFTEDYDFTYYEDIDDNRDEDGYTTASVGEERYAEKQGKIEADSAAITTNSSGDVTFIYKLDKITETALYSLEVEYFLPENRSNSALFCFMVDGKYPFVEAASAELKRTYTVFDSKGLDVSGNEIRSQQQEYFAWTSVTISHQEGLYRNPYRFRIIDSSLASAEKPRTLSITVSREPAVLRTIKLVAPCENDDYATYSAQYSSAEKVTGETIQVEFENPTEKNSISIRSEWDGNYCTYPASYKVTRYNYFGGDRWSTGGDSATWTFTVPKTGLYQIGFRYKTTLTDIVAYREIKIDGEIPFAEMEEYCFPYSDGWYGSALMDENQEPYYFYLTEGTHTITLTSKVGPLRASIQSLQEAMDSISDLVNTVVNITGATRSSSGGYSVDKNRDWDLDKYIAGIEEQMISYRDTFAAIYDQIYESNGGVLPYYGSAVSVAKALFERLSDGQDGLEDIPSSLNEIVSAMSGLSTTLQNITEQPLAIDYMVVTDGSYDYSKCRSNGFQNLTVGAIQFKDSFVKDYSLVGSREETDAEDQVEIEVYVGRGREYVEMLRNLIAEDFTPKTGIKVNVNMVSGGVEGLVMLRYVTGTAPDVAISVGAGSPIQYASRGALVAMNDLDGDGIDDNPELEEVMQLFTEASFVVSRYRGNYYSIPEQQTWAALFYRTDIISELGIEVPDTWDDVYNILPILQENGLDFCYSYGVGNIFPFLYQNGADVYDYNGLASALDTEAAYDAFVEYANLYNKYNLPYAANFYMKFKLGDMPMGLADMGLYCQLKYSAPEINGKWAMAPIPGHLREDGTVDRSISGSGSCCIMIKNKGDKLKSQEGWEFIKWWMSTETQVAYAQEVEATFGVASRWATANKEAIQQMAYSDEELAVINEMWDNHVETPVVLGGYYTTRYLNTALNEAVLQGNNIRIALEDAVREINKEMKRKQKEFFPEWFDEDGNMLDPVENNISIVWSDYKVKEED